MEPSEKVVQYSNRIERLFNELGKEGYEVRLPEKRRALLCVLTQAFAIAAGVLRGSGKVFKDCVADLFMKLHWIHPSLNQQC